MKYNDVKLSDLISYCELYLSCREDGELFKLSYDNVFPYSYYPEDAILYSEEEEIYMIQEDVQVSSPIWDNYKYELAKV